MIIFERVPEEDDTYSIAIRVAIDTDDFDNIINAFKAFMIGITFSVDMVNDNILTREEMEELRSRCTE